ncbi:MAG: alpha/beta hydrolase [Corynebacterium sp.]|nr:alpha/beta hydrolase [Corynebacterium sp.]
MSYITTANKFLTVDGLRIAYREVGTDFAHPAQKHTPLIMLTHLAAVLDNWDPEFIDHLAKNHHVIVIDLPGVGASEGTVADTIEGMAGQAIRIIHALGYEEVDLLGLSMGGMIAQEIVRAKPTLVKHLILAGTAPRGGVGVDRVTPVTFGFMARAAIRRKDPRRYIFYPLTKEGSRVAGHVLGRMAERSKAHADKAMSLRGFFTQLKAIKRWGTAPIDDLGFITQPTLIINGDKDNQVPTENSYAMHGKLQGHAAKSELIIYPNAGHGSIFQYAESAAASIHEFLVEE